jgi:hypothetical protein
VVVQLRPVQTIPQGIIFFEDEEQGITEAFSRAAGERFSHNYKLRKGTG